MSFNLKNTSLVALAACTILSSTAALAGGHLTAMADGHEMMAPNGSFESAITNGKFSIDTRYRFSHVDNGYTDDAIASTLRTNLSYTTGVWKDLTATVEVQNIVQLGHNAHNDTLNGDPRATIADPESTEINEAKITYTGIEDTTVIAGRQRISLDNERFVGTQPYRQNDQTFDAIVAVNNSVKDTTIFASYVNNVNRFQGDDHANGNLDSDTYLLNVGYAGLEQGKLTGYAYNVDFNDAAVVNLSSRTFGARFAGKTAIDQDQIAQDISVTYAIEYAIQSDIGDSTANYDENYYTASLGLSGSNWAGLVGYEVFGSDGTAAFTTPLTGEGHGHNGWADVVSTSGTALNTTGLEDLYFKASYTIKCDDHTFLDGLKLQAAYHQFDSEETSAELGSEVDFKISKNFGKHYSAAISYSDYNADTLSVDTQKVRFTLGAKF